MKDTEPNSPGDWVPCSTRNQRVKAIPGHSVSSLGEDSLAPGAQWPTCSHTHGTEPQESLRFPKIVCFIQEKSSHLQAPQMSSLFSTFSRFYVSQCLEDKANNWFLHLLSWSFPALSRQPRRAGRFYCLTCRRYSAEQSEKRSESIRQKDWMSSKKDNRGLVSRSWQGAQSRFKRWTEPRKRISCFGLKKINLTIL